MAMPKRLPKDISRHIEKLKAKINAKADSQNNAFLNYVAARVFVEETLRVTESLTEWCNHLKRRGVKVDSLLKALTDFRQTFVVAAETDLQANLKGDRTDGVELTPTVPDDAIGEAVWLAKAKFYDREVFYRWLNGELATPSVYDADAWKYLLPFVDYAWWCFVSELDKALPAEFPLTVGVDLQDETVIVNACGWKEILPLTDWQVAEIQKRTNQQSEVS